MITREELDKLIEEGGDKEWRSHRRFREYLDKNRENREFKIIGWVSPRTKNKWFKDGIKEIPRNNDITDYLNLYVLTKGNNYWFVSLFSKEPWKSPCYR